TVPDEKKDSTSTSEAAAKITPRPNATEKLAVMPEMLAPTPERDRNRVLVPLLGGLVLVLIAALGGMWVMTSAPPPTTRATGPTTPTTPPSAGHAPLAPTESLATLYVNSTPPGATIRLGTRGEIGHTPMEVGLLPPGEWPVQLALAGY